MSLHLITGYAGEEHITSADQGAYNMGTYGEGEFVLDRGNKFEASVVSNNSISIADGEALMQGRFIKLAAGTTESVSIDNGTQGMNRRDLICIHYEKDSGTGVETASFVVKKGTETSSTPTDPSYTTGDITDGSDLINEMPLYRVNISGLNISSLDTMFSLKVSMVDYMDNYQLPVASSSRLGGVKVGGEGIGFNNQKLELNLAGQYPASVGVKYGQKGGARLITGDIEKCFGGIVANNDGVIYNRPPKRINGDGISSLAYASTIVPGWNNDITVRIPKANLVNIGIPSYVASGTDEQIKKFIDNYYLLANVGFYANNAHLKVIAGWIYVETYYLPQGYLEITAKDSYSYESSNVTPETMWMNALIINGSGELPVPLS